MADTATNRRSAEGSAGPIPGTANSASKRRASALFTYAFDTGESPPGPDTATLFPARRRRFIGSEHRGPTRRGSR